MNSNMIKKMHTPCNKCGEKLNLENSMRHRKCCKKCHYKQINKKLPTQIEQQNIEEDIQQQPERTLIIGPSGSGKTCLTLNILKEINPRNVYIIAKTEDQYPLKYINQSTEIENLDFYENSHVIFDDMLGSKQAKDIDQFFCRGRHGNINVYYISQSWYSLPKNTIRNNSSVLCIFSQSRRDLQSLYNDIAGFDMSYKERVEFCRKAWSETYNYIQVERFKPINMRYSVRNIEKGQYIRCIPETKPF